VNEFPPPFQDQKWYQLRQASDEMEVCYETLRRYITAGKIEAHRISRTWKIRGYELNRFVESRRVPRKKNS
jgi:excisionase family DNA binding protein